MMKYITGILLVSIMLGLGSAFRLYKNLSKSDEHLKISYEYYTLNSNRLFVYVRHYSGQIIFLFENVDGKWANPKILDQMKEDNIYNYMPECVDY